jgi:hypothetical protein
MLGVESMVQPPQVPMGLHAVLATRPARLVSLLGGESAYRRRYDSPNGKAEEVVVSGSMATAGSRGEMVRWEREKW